ncbi:hypothetical protein BN59_01638 [Legionella massiliensis]|uniref:Dot/Icm secretion system substrate n=1 Tax=Legionella massiliensis TaxID=1034943 RepID=A0A078KSC1_9GAMM|nr:hypothetical protein [Legionella massiliensis]CDZ77355.1 hypothetical protein BN59_01638 [Legionella massiliensis]CEE13093.1 hypothetical protein BN1094_01638 [Legionella massiliensis]
MSKWKIFYNQNAQSKTSAGKAIASCLNTGLAVYLTTKKTEKSIQENHPQDLLLQAKDSLGKLSRIFEQMHWPIPAYEKISAEVTQIGLRAYTESLLDDILPILLDESGSKLNRKVINAINFAGQGLVPPINNLYGEYCKRNFEEEIANQFVQAIIVSFTQKVLDVEKAKSIKLMNTEIAKLTSKLHDDTEAVVSESPSEEEKTERLSQLANAYQEAVRNEEDADRDRQTRFHEQFNTPMEALAKLTSIQGIQPTLDIDNMKQAKRFVKAFDQLVVHAETVGIEIPGLVEAQGALLEARELIADSEGFFAMMDDKPKVSKITQGLLGAANRIIDAMDATLDFRLPSPVENSLWQRFLNLFITTKEMEVYNRQKALLDRLTHGYNQQVSIKVEFTEDGAKVIGLDSVNAKARFLNELNDVNDIEYTIDQDGNLSKVVDEVDEDLSEDDIVQLKEVLEAIDGAPDNLYRIKQIEPEVPSNTMRM